MKESWDKVPREEAKEAKKEKRTARTYGELMAEAWMQKFLEGNATAMTQLLNRTEGKVLQPVSHSGEVDLLGVKERLTAANRRMARLKLSGEIGDHGEVK